MSHVMGMALALAMGWNGTNGFDPDDLLLIQNGQSFSVDETPRLREWFMRDPTNNADLMRYLVRCAMARGKVVTLGSRWTFPGELGLAEPLPDPVDVDGKGNYRVRIITREAARGAVGRWVSACILAHANMRSYHQFISIRGNPANEAARKALAPSPGERWTSGDPEGVFFGNLFDPVAKACQDLKGFTVSMNLPGDYQGPAAGWRPPNAVVGRTLDFDAQTSVEPPGGGIVRIAKKLGTYAKQKKSFGASSSPVDPDYDADAVCLGHTDKIAPCSDPTQVRETLRPLFVHLPRLADLESPVSAADPAVPFQVLARGAAIRADQARSCPSGTCVGPHPYLRAAGPVAHPAHPGEGGKLVGLSAGQILEPTLRFIAGLEAKGSRPGPTETFTAIIRYACKEPECKAVVRVPGGAGAWTLAGDTWPSTGCSDRYQWLQVHPVRLPAEGAETTLRIRVEGAGGPAPELDAVGFVAGEPRCDGTLDPTPSERGPFMGVCRYR